MVLIKNEAIVICEVLGECFLFLKPTDIHLVSTRTIVYTYNNNSFCAKKRVHSLRTNKKSSPPWKHGFSCMEKYFLHHFHLRYFACLQSYRLSDEKKISEV